jgi:FixJ family two-component response regulator
VTGTDVISIVDDDESMREALTSLIRSVGFKARTYASGEDVLRCGHLRESACLIVDVQMPGMSGLELQRRLAVARSTIPIIFITAHGDEHQRMQAIEDGAVEYLFKPFSENALLNALHSALERKRA